MTRTLLVMRHAKSSWKQELADHERPLNGRGRRAATRMAVELDRLGWLPERVLCSSAVRTRETLAWMQDALGRELNATVTPSLYLPPTGVVLGEVAEVANEVSSVMVLCHNPACESVVGFLTGERVEITTANVARIEIDAPTWTEAMAMRGMGRLVGLIRPRELVE